MQLYLMRHGIALDVGQEGIQRDCDRTLSKEGRQKTAEVAEGLKAIGVQPARILHSPLVRARETARIVADILSPAPLLEECEWLQPGSPPASLAACLRAQTAEAIMTVGHLPDIADFASFLLSGRTNLDLQFKKAAVACVIFEEPLAPGRGCLEWLMQPAQLRRLR